MGLLDDLRFQQSPALGAQLLGIRQARDGHGQRHRARHNRACQGAAPRFVYADDPAICHSGCEGV
jgi:hypothetical protein